DGPLRLVPRPVSLTSRRTIPVLLGSKPLSSARDKRSPGARRRAQPTDPSQDRREQHPGYRYLRQLERHRLGVAGDLGPDLDQLLPQRRQRPSLHRRGQRQLTQEVAQVVGQGEQLQPGLIVLEPAARQPGPLQGVLPLLDPLLDRPTILPPLSHLLSRILHL